jgi:hypothetical protein
LFCEIISQFLYSNIDDNRHFTVAAQIVPISPAQCVISSVDAATINFAAQSIKQGSTFPAMLIYIQQMESKSLSLIPSPNYEQSLSFIQRQTLDRFCDALGFKPQERFLALLRRLNPWKKWSKAE